MDDKERIYESVISEFSEKGIRFTMDDVAKRIKMSKKTIYKRFDTKEQIFMGAVEYGFKMVKVEEERIISDDSLDIVEKIKKC